VQQSKRKMELFSRCTVSHLGGCRVWVEPVTSGMRPMLHGDRWLHRACRMAKRMKGGLFQFLVAQLAGSAPLSSGAAAQHTEQIRSQQVPPLLYRAYGSQMGISRAVLRERDKAFYERLLLWLITPHDDMAKVGFLGMWRAYTTKEKAILIELAWMAIFRAERFIRVDVCSECLAIAAALPRPPDAVGASCTADYFTGAPRVEQCNVTGDGWGGRPPCGEHCGRLNMRCPMTKNDDEVAPPVAREDRRSSWRARSIRHAT